MDINNLAATLDEAALNAKAIPQLSLQEPFSIGDAYKMQRISINRRYERGEKFVGMKLGFTSKAKMEQMGVHNVIWGRLTDSMELVNNGILNLEKFIHPRAEPEIAFRVSKTINKVLSRKAARAYIDAVAPAIEIIDSRYENFKFSLEDVVADNCSSSAYVIGEWLNPDTAINDIEIELTINDDSRQRGNSNAILGDPIESLIEMSKMAAQYGLSVKKGDIILAGAATPAEYIASGDQIKAKFQKLGTLTLNVV